MLLAKPQPLVVGAGVLIVPVHRPRLQAHFERSRTDGDPRYPFQAGRRFPRWHGYVEGVEEGGEEEEELHPGQDLAQAHPPADSEG